MSSFGGGSGGSEEEEAPSPPAPAAAAAAAAAAVPKRSWDPLAPENMQSRSPTKACLSRIRKDLKSLYSDPLPGIFIIQDETHNCLLHALIVGPCDTPYENGFFYFIINCPDDYPFSPPAARLLTTGSGSVRFSPNLYANGKVCLSILGTWSGPSWSQVQSIGSVCLSIQTLMGERPFHNEPGYEAAAPALSDQYNCIIRHEVLRVAVLDMCTPTSEINVSLPERLRACVTSLFPSFLASYLLTVDTYKSKDGIEMIDPFGGTKRGYFQFTTVGQRLQLLAQEMDEQEEATKQGGGECEDTAYAEGGSCDP